MVSSSSKVMRFRCLAAKTVERVGCIQTAQVSAREKKIGRYVLMEPIGSGAMGTVYRAHDPLHDRTVAVKVAHSPSHQDESVRSLYASLFFNEMRAASILSHPNIVEVVDAGSDDERYYIAMEYIDGGVTLDHWCRGKSLMPLERAVETILKCAQALDYAHRQGVIHRDIKPGNVLITPTGEAKLADFSVALLTDPGIKETQVMRPVGSPVYMAPESLRNEGVSARSDLFSLGNVLYELVTGRLPFAAETVAGVTHKVMTLDPAPLSDWRSGVPEGLQSVVSKALARDPEERYSSAMEMAAHLASVFSQSRLADLSDVVDNRAEKLMRLNFFAEFGEAEIWELLRWAHWDEFEAGTPIVREHEDEHSLYVLVEGQVEVSKDGQPVRDLPPGDCFGEIAYLSERRRSATVTALTRVTTLRLNAEVIAKTSLDCQVQFQREFIKTLIERLVRTTADLVRH